MDLSLICQFLLLHQEIQVAFHFSIMVDQNKCLHKFHSLRYFGIGVQNGLRSKNVYIYI